MPAQSKSQQRLFSMALAVRHGKLKRSEVNKSDTQIEHFTKLKSLKEHLKSSL